MKNKLKSFIVGGFLTATLLATTAPVFAHDYWHWSRQYNRWTTAPICAAIITI